MKTLNNGGVYDNTPTRHVLAPTIISHARSGLYLIKQLSTGAPWKSLNKVLLLKTALSLNVDKSSWCLLRAFTPTD